MQQVLQQQAPYPAAASRQVASNSRALVIPVTAEGETALQRNSAEERTLLAISHRLAQINEQSWLSIGRLALAMQDFEKAKLAFDQALRHNPVSLAAIQAAANLHKQRENYPVALELYNKLTQLDPQNSDAWSSVAFCFQMQDDFQKAFFAYQKALYYAPSSKDPNLWYGLGLLYERHGSDEQAEEFFINAVRCDAHYERVGEIFFRLGLLLRAKGKYDKSAECFVYLQGRPPKPLSEADVQFQLGVLAELSGDQARSGDIFTKILTIYAPRHARTLQFYAWSLFQAGNLESAIGRVAFALEVDPADPISWYIFGRCHVAQRNTNRAYEAYQQAVLRNGKNPTFWCSIGLLYFQIQQYRDALDAFSKAIHMNPSLWEIWWNLGILYETCNNQVADAVDSYRRALEVSPANVMVAQRLHLLQQRQSTGSTGSGSIPSPLDLQFSVPLQNAWQIFGSGSAAGAKRPPLPQQQPRPLPPNVAVGKPQPISRRSLDLGVSNGRPGYIQQRPHPQQQRPGMPPAAFHAPIVGDAMQRRGIPGQPLAQSYQMVGNRNYAPSMQHQQPTHETLHRS